MSIYSGFATRNLQQSYDQYICDLLFVLQKRILKFYQNAEADQQKFWNIFSQLYHQIIHLQKCKYLEPKSSEYVTQMYYFLKAKKIQREQDPEEDLKKFERSMALKINTEIDSLKLKQTQVNNFIRRSSFSFGKIKRQLEPGKSLNASSSTKNQPDSGNNSFDFKLEAKVLNPQEKKALKEKRIFSSKGIRNKKDLYQEKEKNFKQENAEKRSNGHPAQEIIKQYLQKTNKNYLRGYRKRKIKQDFGVSQNTVQTSKNLAREKSSGR